MYIDVKLLVEMYLHIVFYGHSMMPNYDHKVLYKLFVMVFFFIFLLVGVPYVHCKIWTLPKLP